MMYTSQSGINLIKSFEAFEPLPYLDQAGILTIGYGTIEGVTKKTCVSEPMADLMLRGYLRGMEIDLYKLLHGVYLTQDEFDAIASLVYNIGVNGFRESTCLRLLRECDKKGAFEALQWWNKVTIDGKKVVSQGLVNRRRQEAAYAGYPAWKLS